MRLESKLDDDLGGKNRISDLKTIIRNGGEVEQYKKRLKELQTAHKDRKSTTKLVEEQIESILAERE
jgi:hypothetical protein